MLTSLEIWLLKRLGAPKWEDSDANTITVWRTRAGTVGTFGFYGTYWLGNTLFPASIWEMCIFASVAIFVLAAIADLADGAVARSEGGKKTDVGQFIDPVGDKFIVLTAYIVLIWHFRWQEWMWPMLLVVVYDMGVVVARSRLAQMRTQWVAKIKSFVLFVGMGSLLWGMYAGEKARRGEVDWEDWFADALWIGSRLLWLAAALCLVSATLYALYATFPALRIKVDTVCDWLYDKTSAALSLLLSPIVRRRP